MLPDLDLHKVKDFAVPNSARHWLSVGVAENINKNHLQFSLSGLLTAGIGHVDGAIDMALAK